MDRNPKPILILGGTGHYGRNIVRNLLDKGETVKVLSRNAATAQKILGDKAKIIEGDITSRRSVVEAIQGVRAIVISISAFSLKTIRQLKHIERDSVLMVLEEAEKAGINRIVYISVYDIREDFLKEMKITWEIPEIKKEVEDILAKSSFNWTILVVAPSMQIFFSMIKGNTMMIPGGGHPSLPNVSSQDVGEITAQTVLRDDLNCKRIRITGPKALSFSEAAGKIGLMKGKIIGVRKIPLLSLKIAATLTYPFNPYLSHLVKAVKLMNNYPQYVVDIASKDHQWLVDNFDYIPTTLETEASKYEKTQ
ncbi:SDR family oxidoreductase [Chloroflexota bacterium]